VTTSESEASRPSLRVRKREQTRRAILEAIAEIEMVHGGAIDPSLITYARIAEIAEVSERTVYRFFPTKAALDQAYSEELPVGLGTEMAMTDMESYAKAMEEVGRRWTERLGPVRVAEHEIGADEYPESLARRRERDAQVVRLLLDERPELRDLPEVQQRAIAAVINHTLSIRSVAIIAQRWNLTIEEATRAQAWAARAIVAQLASQPPDPWGDV
jgi:AcrR family transcriptional regulator